MSYFKTTIRRSSVANFNTDIAALDSTCILKKYYTTHEVPQDGTGTFTCNLEGLALPITNISNYGFSSRSVFNIDTSTGAMNGTGNLSYGDSEFPDCDAFTVYDGSAINKSFVFWKDGDDNDYIFSLYNSSSSKTMGLASNNPDIKKDSSHGFAIVANNELQTPQSSLNSPSANYVIQPLIALGIRTPLYMITGGNNVNMPLFSEIEADGTQYFVIGNNYCVKM